MVKETKLTILCPFEPSFVLESMRIAVKTASLLGEASLEYQYFKTAFSNPLFN